MEVLEGRGWKFNLPRMFFNRFKKKENKQEIICYSFFFSKKQINFKGERIDGKSDLPRTNDYIREVIGKRCDNS